MKSTVIIVFVLAMFFKAQGQTVEKLWETDAVFKVPESTLFDDSVVYVSNVNGKPDEKNNMGFISRMGADGKILQMEWINGINAPKGMGVFKDKLYVSDIDRVVVVDRKKGSIIQFIDIPGTKFLNDIAVSKNGMVAVSDMQDASVYLIDNDKVIQAVKDPKLENVNGLCWVDKILYAGTGNIIYSLDKEDWKPDVFIEGTGGVDGLENYNEQSFIISDWQGKVQIVSKTANPVILINTTGQGKNAADIGYIAAKNIILVPTFFGNTVSAYKIVK